MIEMKVQISQETYQDWLKANPDDKEKFIISVAKRTAFPPNAYGCYPIGVLVEDGKYYAIWHRYNNCD